MTSGNKDNNQYTGFELGNINRALTRLFSLQNTKSYKDDQYLYDFLETRGFMRRDENSRREYVLTDLGSEYCKQNGIRVLHETAAVKLLKKSK